MSDRELAALAELRQLRRGLRELGEAPAPPTLAGAVLAEVGLADAFAPLETPLGRAFVAYNAQGIAYLAPAESAEAFERAFRARFGRAVRPAGRLPERLERVVLARLRGERGGAPRFDLRGLSPFERAVLAKTVEIPRGEVRPYAWVAREIGRPRAVRAVGSALGRNPVPLLIPCHRVIRSDGRPGEYALGAAAKRTVLAAEGLPAESLDELAQAGIRYLGSDTTHIVCHPTCRAARRIGERHRVPFASLPAAEAAGYRPCQLCRP